MGRRADSPGGVFVCVCLSGGAVSANGQETLNARGYKPTHTSTFSFSLSHTYSHNTTVLRSGKLRQAACSVTTWVSGWSENGRIEKKPKVVSKGRKWLEGKEM